MTLCQGALFCVVVFAAAAASVPSRAEESIHVSNAVLVLHDDEASAVQRNAVEAFARRLRLQSNLHVVVAAEGEAVGKGQLAGAPYEFLVLAGVSMEHGGLLRGFKADPPPGNEGFHVAVGGSRGWPAQAFPRTGHLAVVSGHDSRGMLFGLGKLLRLADFRDGGFTIVPQTCVETPAIAQRGVYFATHFNNFYESAPVEEIEAYVEDMAFWGFNSIWTWFDMHWYPEGFWTDPGSAGMQLLNRIRKINEKARSLGLMVGLTGIANEGFKEQPPKQLLADMSERRGGYYPESTICPSAPGGMEMILENRRKVLELVGPIDAYVTWPFDQGGCGCSKCRPWARTFMKINPTIAEEVRRQNPGAKFLVSTWYFTEDEMQMMLSIMKEDPRWFDGVVTETKWADTFAPPASYERIVFPEISMEGSLFCGYGGSGANPMPTKFLAQARQAAAQGYGCMLYSEGIYEDLNKVVWGTTLWNPERSVEDIILDYVRFYFGSERISDWTDLIMGLEETWPPDALLTKDRAMVEKLSGLAEELGAAVPPTPTSRSRWQYLMDRAEMDSRMVQIGSDEELLSDAKAVLTDAGYVRDMETFRRDVQRLRDRAAARAQAVKALFQFHWEYLGRADLDRTTSLVTMPPGFVGQRDWDRLSMLLDEALAATDGESMRMAVLRGFKEWFWYNNITLDFLLSAGTPSDSAEGKERQGKDMMKDAAVVIDAAQVTGDVKPLHDMCNGPICLRGFHDFTPYYKELGLRYVRLHDVPFTWDNAQDIHYVFPDMEADPDLPESYDFGQTDFYLQSIASLGIDMIYRLGYSIEFEKSPRVHDVPPASFTKWASICAHIVRHYNQGWAGGQPIGIKYWEIWNEPDQEGFWRGTPEEFYRLYETTAKVLRETDSSIRIGGPALALDLDFLDGFLAHCRKYEAPLDFVSWHIYSADWREVVERAAKVRGLMDNYGFLGAQSVLDEWNYARAGVGRETMFTEQAGMPGAAFDAAVLIRLQDAPVDIATFYTGTHLVYGLFNAYGTPHKAYYAFLAFRRMLDTPLRLALEASNGEDVPVLAGISEDQKTIRVLISNPNSRTRRIHFRLRNLPWTGRTQCEKHVVTPEHNLDSLATKRIDGEDVELTEDVEGQSVCLLTIGCAKG